MLLQWVHFERAFGRFYSLRFTEESMAAVAASHFQLPHLPVKIFSDFDGTISDQDSLKLILNRHGGDRWKILEAAVMEGRMAEAEALPQMFANFPLLPDAARREILDSVQIDPTFPDFANWCSSNGYDLTILSGGFESFIRPLLAREGLSHLPIIANDVLPFPSRIGEKGRADWQIKRAAPKALCSLCTHCKSSTLLKASSASQDFIVYIGDGHTDFCPMQLAHLVFAKSSLKDYCQAYDQDFVGFQNFSDIRQNLQAALEILNISLEAGIEESTLNVCESTFGYRYRNYFQSFSSLRRIAS